MQNRSKPNRRSGRRKLRLIPRFKKDKDALSSVITVCGIIAAILGFIIAPLFTIYIPKWTKEAEAEHMDETADAFASLRGNINHMIERNKIGTTASTRLKLGTELNNYFLPDSTGTLYLKPYSPEFSIFNADNPIDLYAKSYGSIEYSSNNHEYTDQRFIYENGAVIKEQDDVSTMELRPELDIQKHTSGKVVLDDSELYGNLPGYDTSHKRSVDYEFTGITGEVTVNYDIYSNNYYLYENPFETNNDGDDWTQRLTDWYVEREVARPDVIAQWSFSEPQDTAFEENNPKLSTLSGTFSGGATHGTGKFGSAIDLVASASSIVTVANANPLQISGAHTFECWIYPYDVLSTKYIVSKLKDASLSGYGLMQVGDEIKYILGDGSAYYELESTNANIIPNKWTHIAGAWDGSKMYLYINGQKNSEMSFPGPLQINSLKLVFGSNQAENGNFFNGRIDEIIFSSVAKTTFDLNGVYSTRGNIWSDPDECLAVLEKYGDWVPEENGQDWLYRKQITIKSSKITGYHINFPFLIELTDPDLKNHARSDGSDILFTPSDGFTKLDHEIVSYDSSSGELIAWVKVPELSSGADTVLYMYYSNSAASDQSDPTSLWSSGYRGVWHLEEDPSSAAPQMKDKTSNANHGTSYGTMTSGDRVEGMIGNSLDFDGIDDYIRMGDPADGSLDFGTNDLTISAWVNLSTTVSMSYPTIVSKGAGSSSSAGFWFFWYDSLNYLRFTIGDGSSRIQVNSIGSIDDGSWHYVTAVADRDANGMIYIDGQLDNSADFSSKKYDSISTSINFDVSDSASNSRWEGFIDEVRISESVKSSDWIATEYANQNNPGDCITVSPDYDYVYHISKFDILERDTLDLDWKYRKRITIKSSQVAGDLTNFPVLISFADPDLASKARTDGHDIYFTSSDKKTRLAHEVESYNSATGNLIAWVKVPSLSSTQDTVLYMYYGNADASDQSNPSGVWDSDYVGIWHLEELGSGSADEFKDSSLSGNHGQGGGGTSNYVPGQVIGKIGYSQVFDGTNDYIDCGYDTSLDISGNQITLESWIFFPGYNPSHYIGIMSHSGWSEGYRLIFRDTGNALYLHLPEDESWLGSAQDVSTNTWAHVVGVYDGSNMKLYIDGAEDVNTQAKSNNVETSTNEFWIGHGDNVVGQPWSFPFIGIIDELRVSNVARSADWIATEYNNQNSPGTFFTKSPEEDLSLSISSFDESWKYRKPITIDASKVAADLTNFPLLINIQDPDLKDNARSDGYDILFTSSNGIVKLDHEIESYDYTTGALIAWVKIPLLSATEDTEIYMYYGNPDASDQSNPSGVWDSNYKGVWHLKETGTGTRYDSTSNNNDGTPLGYDGDEAITGKINGADDLDGVDDYIKIDSVTIGIDSVITVQFWMKTVSTADEALVGFHDSGGSNKWRIETISDKIAVEDSKGYVNVNDGIWHYVVAVTDGTKSILYIDGALDRDNIGKTVTLVDTDQASIGQEYDGGSTDQHFDGIIDEVRISKSVHSASWIATEYNNQNSPGTFYTVGIEETDMHKRSALIVESQMMANEYSDRNGDAYLVFDYRSDTDYKYAGLSANADMWFIGHRLPSGYYDNITMIETIDYNRWYNVSLRIIDDTVQLYNDDELKLSYRFDDFIAGKFGLATSKSHPHYDNYKIYYERKQGIEVWVNDEYIGKAEATKFNEWGLSNELTINSKLLYADKPNTIMFKNTFSPSKHWAVRNVVIKGHPTELSLNLITLSCEERTIGGSDSHVIQTKLVRSELNEYYLFPANVTLGITTRYHDAWWDYFNTKLNETGNNLNWRADRSTTDFFLWSVPISEDLHSIYITFNRINKLNCAIAVVETTVD
ncbi:MAG: DUF2341 domain-containing protein [Thermoplasmata archaeon]|nr:MAG: DUF2341 domain-containing protein [Thermoplasmata archaeon]